MNFLEMKKVEYYVNENIDDFHRRRLVTVENLTLNQLLKKNPYLFRAKNLTVASDLIGSLLEAFLSSSEEKIFGDFLENLALFVAQETVSGHKSTAPGVDLEFFNLNTHFIVSIKSGTNWGNSSQQSKLAQDLRNAVARLKQSRVTANVQPVLGICYGKTRTQHTKTGYLKVVGQNFWYMISENKELYTEIIEPLGYQAREHNERFHEQRGALVNRLTIEFMQRFCTPSGTIDWIKLVEFNSKNFDLDSFL
ncbi:MAG: cytosolic protein [Caldilineaceae bacterium]|nr:cytosolic protein [Caldilineaceae bacterium]